MSVRARFVCKLRRHWVTIRYKFSHKHPCDNWLFNSLTSGVGSCNHTETANQWVNGSVVLGADESPWPCGTPSWYTPLSWIILSKQKNLHLFSSQYVCVFSKTSVHPSVCLSEWKIKLLELIQTRGKSLKKKIKCRPVKKVLKNPDSLKELKRLKEQFVLVPSIGFICKKYFLEVLLQETKSNTYVAYQDSAESIIIPVAKKCLEIGIPVKEDNKTLPQIHATIKMHKNPVKFRFIIGGKKLRHQASCKKACKNPPAYYEDTQEILQQDQVLYRNGKILDYWK